MAKFKIGDIVVGNKKANRYGITVQGWIGKVTYADTHCFNARSISSRG